MSRHRKASARHRTAGVVSSEYADFAVGDRVRVKEGFLGTVTAVEDGPFPGTEQYQVTLDDGMGGGTWGVGEVQGVETTTAGLTPQQEFANGVADTYESLGGESLPRYVASEDYPELAEILVVRPPLPHSEPLRMNASKTAERKSATWQAQEVEERFGGSHDAWEQFVEENDQGSGCDDIARAVEEQFSIPQVFGWFTLPNGRREQHSWNEIDGTIVDMGSYTMGHDYNGLHVYQRGVDPEAKAYGEPGFDYSAWDASRKTSAAVDWDQVHLLYWCEQCGFKGDVPPNGTAFDVCPQCGHVEPYHNIDGNPLTVAASADKNISPEEQGADQHVLIATAGLWDRVRGLGLDVLNTQMADEHKYVPGHNPSGPEWCRFRKDSRCYFPKTLNAEATKVAGYAVWNPEDRGACPRISWDEQKACPVGEPGPDSGDPQSRLDATVAWEDGGQRPTGTGHISHDPYDRRRSSLNIVADLQKQSAFEFTASWSDVRAKAKRIRTEGGVRIISAPRPNDEILTITAEVKGDNHTYETTLLRTPGRKSVASWSCGCAWASYSWARSGPWKKYEGRMCSHALAVQYEAQAQGMNGGQIKERGETPPWRMDPFHYEKPPRKAASLRPVDLDGSLAEAPLSRISRESSLSVEAKAMLFRNLKALVRGGIRTIKMVFADSGTAEVEGMSGEVPVREILYPTWHPSLGLSLRHHGSLAHVVDGSDGPHMPGSDLHYPYDEQWADPSRWGRDHFAFEAAVQEGPTHAGLVLKAADTGRVLMLQRCLQDDDDPAAGTWEFPGGGIEPGDTTSLHAAMREFAEEVGVAVPEGGHVSHVWTTANGVYTGHVVVIPSEDMLDLSRGRDEVNPDDPDGDFHEQSAWWTPEDAKKNPALRAECKDNPWGEITRAAKTGALIDIGGGRDVEFGHLGYGVNGDYDYMTDPGFLTPDPEGFHDPLSAYSDPVEPEPALPFAEGKQVVAYAGFAIPDDATLDEATDAVMQAAEEHANQVTRLLSELAADHHGRMDPGKDGQMGYRLKKRKRLREKIEEDMREKHLRADQAAESMSDSLRFTILLASDEYSDGAQEIMDEMARRGYRPSSAGRVKNFWLRHDPYDGINGVFLTPSGFPFELQFHTDQSLAVKMRNHVEYDEYRDSKTTPERRKHLWDVMVGRTHLLPRPPGEAGIGRHKFQGSVSVKETYYAFLHKGSYTGVFRLVETPGDARFERYSHSQSAWVMDNSQARHLIKGAVDVAEISQPVAMAFIASLETEQHMASLHSEALVVEAITDPQTAPEMAEAIGESLASSPPSPGDPRLAWLMSGASAGAASGAGGGSPQTASDGDIAAQAKAHLAKVALKDFTPAEQQEIINEGLDVLASNLGDLDIAGTHYEGLEAAFAQAEAEGDDEELFG